MQINEESLKVIRDVVSATLSADNKTRKDAETYLVSLETQAGFLPVVLTLIHTLTGSVAYGNDFSLSVNHALYYLKIVLKNIGNLRKLIYSVFIKLIEILLKRM